MAVNNIISEATQTQFYNRMKLLTPTKQSKWGSMTVEQMLAHMNDAFKLSLGMKESVDTSNFFWNKILFPIIVYAYPGFPKNSPTAPELNQKDKGTAARDFYTEFEFLRKMMEVFNEREESKLKHHPLFGVLNKKQWCDLLVKHLDYHLRQFGV